MTFIREHQLDFMMFMSGVTSILAVTMLVMKFPTSRRKRILASMAFSSMALLLFDRCAYIFRGNTDPEGYYMVRVSNGLVFFLLIFILFLVTQYLKDLLTHEGKQKTVPFSLRLCDLIFVAGTVLISVSQFTNLYYYIDDQNIYHRSPLMIISYFPPVLIVILQEISVIRNRKKLNRSLKISLLLSIALPTIASVVQIFTYGISLSSMALAFAVIIYYVYMLIDSNKEAIKARTREIEFYKEARRIEAAMFEQTAEALVNAIDAKDIYTHGHSSRVAVYSRKIAERAGMSKDDCDKVYFAALLHDVGKIGVPNNIINKVGKLTDEEYEEMKRHTVLGDQILSSIKQSPTLRIGALYHHERYDGSGYPEGLSGDGIPEIARIIAVADAYDAMASDRSYRSALPTSKVKEELIDGVGRQFDPQFAGIMLDIIDENEEKNGSGGADAAAQG